MATQALRHKLSPVVSSKSSRKVTVRAVCMHSADQRDREEQRSARREVSASAGMASGLDLPSSTVPILPSWLGMLDLFFLNDSRKPAGRNSGYDWISEVSDVNFGTEDEDDHAVHMYESHLASRMAMEPLHRE